MQEEQREDLQRFHSSVAMLVVSAPATELAGVLEVCSCVMNVALHLELMYNVDRHVLQGTRTAQPLAPWQFTWYCWQKYGLVLRPTLFHNLQNLYSHRQGST